MKNAFNIGETDEYPNGEFESLSTVDPEFENDSELEFRRSRPIPVYRARGVRSVPRFGRSRAPLFRRGPRPGPGFRGAFPRGATNCTCPAVNCPEHGEESVRWVQSSLNRILNLRLRVTGVMDAATRSALRGFQQQQGLPADGIAGPDTQSALVTAARGGMSGSPNGSANASMGTPDSASSAADAPEPTSATPAHAVAPQESELDRETSASPCAHFTPIAVEKPGGGRIKNKSAPKASEIVQVSRAFGGKVPLHRLAAMALNALQCAARASGIKAPLFQPTSGFRDPKRQAKLWATALKKYGSPEEARKWVAPPGGSAHQSGRAIDFYLGGKNSSANVANLRKLRAYQWLVANARRFGFYPYEREPWHWEYNPPAAQQSEWHDEMLKAYVEPEFEQARSTSAPACWEPEKASHGETLYLKIDLGLGRNLACTGVYIPNSFRPDQEFTVVVYLHGHKGAYPGNSVPINGYWDANRFPFFALREEIAASQRNVIFVAPSLGPKSQAGNLIQPRGFDRFTSQVLSGVNQHYSAPRSGRPIAAIQSIILAAHSGGGAPMLRIATGKDLFASKIKQYWCFDSMYGAVASAWIAWAKSHPDSRLFVYYGPGRGRKDPKTGKLIPYPFENAKTIACLSRNSKLANVCVQASRARRLGKVDAHFWVPKVHLNERLLNGPCTNPDLCTQKKARVRSEFEFPAFAVSP